MRACSGNLCTKFDTLSLIRQLRKIGCVTWYRLLKFSCESVFKPAFHYTANATTTTQKQSDYKVEQSSFTLIALF